MGVFEKKQTPVPFKQITDGFQVGSRLFIRSDGLEYILRLIQNPGQSIACCDLYFGSEHRKGRDGDKEKCRQKVRRSIRAAIIKIIEQAETKKIGSHLKDSIKTGASCVYVGTWEWEL